MQIDTVELYNFHALSRALFKAMDQFATERGIDICSPEFIQASKVPAPSSWYTSRKTRADFARRLYALSCLPQVTWNQVSQYFAATAYLRRSPRYTAFMTATIEERYRSHAVTIFGERQVGLCSLPANQTAIDFFSEFVMATDSL